MEGLKQFPCSLCEKICKSKGGLTNHTRRKHAEAIVGKETASKSDVRQPSTIGNEAIKDIVEEIKKKVRDTNLYGKDTLDEVEKLQPSGSFYNDLAKLYKRFAKNLNQDKFLEKFYGIMHTNWKGYFPATKDGKYAFVMLIHLPEKLVRYYKERNLDGDSEVCKPVFKISTMPLFNILLSYNARRFNTLPSTE